MKKLFLSLLAFVSIIAAACAEPMCVTNVILSSLQPGAFTVVGAPDYIAHNSGTIEGFSLLSVDCDLGPVISIPIEYSGSTSRAAAVSWECTPQCGPGGAFVIRAPALAASISFRVFVSGQCQLSYCLLDVTYYDDVDYPRRFFPYVW